MDTREQENKKYKKQKQINSKNTKNTKYQNIAKQKENNNNNKLKMSVFEGFTHPYSLILSACPPLVDIIPRATTSVNTVDKTLHHRSFVPLWGKSMIVHDETRVSWFDIPCGAQDPVLSFDLNVQEWQFAILFHFNHELEFGVQLIDFTQFFLDFGAFDFANDVIHVTIKYLG